jgi:hypothetical protein
MYFAAAATSEGVARNNVLFDGGSGQVTFLNGGNWTFDHNAWPDGNALGQFNVLEDPQFVSPGVGQTDPQGFRLAEGSPALLSGTGIESVSEDYDCEPRDPATPSLGIFEAPR